MLGIIPRATALAFSILWLTSAHSHEPPTLEIVSPIAGSSIELGADLEKAIGVVLKSNYALLPAGKCGTNPQCGHVHMKIDPSGETCNIPGMPYNSMNSDVAATSSKLASATVQMPPEST
jgi:hypothetical protein